MLKYAMIASLALTTACVEQQVDNRPGRNYDLAFANCQRITGASGTYVIGPKATNGVPVVVAGQGGNLRGEVLMNECIAQNLGTTVAKVPVKQAKVAPGKLPLPTQYPLLAGDAELWPTLTRAQQDRALTFLKQGGTIRDSLNYE
ncbi:MAG: hypothetical protein ABI459_00555 [Deltaproteobacteria bacterium]